MARIQYSINKDAEGNAVVVIDVLQILPGDEISFVTDTPKTALKVTDDSPFTSTSLSVGKTYKVPMKNEPVQSFVVAKAISGVQWACGELGDDHPFTAWLGAGPGFPPIRSGKHSD